MMSRSDGSCPHSQPAGLDPSAAQRDGIRSQELRDGGLICKSSQQVFSGKPGGSETCSGTNQKFAAMHTISCEARLPYDTPAATWVAVNGSRFVTNKTDTIYNCLCFCSWL